ncbi:hypothetical protein KQX54_004767, partial [Cotesia glomerata]
VQVEIESPPKSSSKRRLTMSDHRKRHPHNFQPSQPAWSITLLILLLLPINCHRKTVALAQESTSELANNNHNIVNNNNNNNSNYNKSLDVSTSRLISSSTDNYKGILVFERDVKDSPIIQENHSESEPAIIPECASIGCLYDDDNKSPSDSELVNSTLNPIVPSKIPPQTENHSKISRNNNNNDKLKVLRKQYDGRSRNESFEHDKLEVTILGLFELSTGNEPRHEGLTELAAAQLAIDRVNQMNMLDNFRLRLIHNDTKSDLDGVRLVLHIEHTTKADTSNQAYWMLMGYTLQLCFNFGILVRVYNQIIPVI